MTETSERVTGTLHLTQSLIVVAVVAGGVSLFLLVANIVLGCLLWIHSSDRSERRRSGNASQTRNLTRKKASPKQGLPGSKRILYRRHSRIESGSPDDGHDTLAFESADSSETEDAAGDVWNTIPGSDSHKGVNYYSQSYKRNWDVILSTTAKGDDGGPSTKIQFSHKNKDSDDDKGLEYCTQCRRHDHSIAVSKGVSKTGTNYTDERFTLQETAENVGLAQKAIDDHKEGLCFMHKVTKPSYNSSQCPHQPNVIANTGITVYPNSQEADENNDSCISTNREQQNEVPTEWVPQFTATGRPRDTTSSKTETRTILNNGDFVMPIRPLAFDSDDQHPQTWNRQNGSDEHNNTVVAVVKDEISRAQKQKPTLLTNNAAIFQPDAMTPEIETTDRNPTADIDTLTCSSRLENREGGETSHRNGAIQKTRRPGKLYRKRHQIIDRVGTAKDKISIWKKLSYRIPSPPPQSSLIASLQGEAITEEEEEHLSEEGSLPHITSIKTPQEHLEHVAIEGLDQHPVGAELDRGNVLHFTLENENIKTKLVVQSESHISAVETQDMDDYESNSRTDYSVAIPRSPVLDWSITDDAKQSYFSQNHTLSSIEEHDFTMRSSRENTTTESNDDSSIRRPETPALKVINKNNDSAGQNGHNNPTYKVLSSHIKDVHIVRWPIRKRSFMHRLLNRSQPSKNQILNTYFSEDTVHVDDDRSVVRTNTTPLRGRKQTKIAMNNKTGRDYRDKIHSTTVVLDKTAAKRNYNTNRILQTRFRRPFQREYYYNNMGSLFPFIMPRLTLSEDDLGMYPDDSVPTIDELVQNSTIRRKKAKRKRLRQKQNSSIQNNCGALSNHPELITLSSNGGQINSRKNIHQTPKREDECIGFHTGVSDKYHSISGERKASLRHLRFHNHFNSKTSRFGLGGPLYVPDHKENGGRDNVTSRFQDGKSVPDDIQSDRGNWSINITTPRSNSPREVDSVSSFALSDFDMGESDVDEMNKSDNDDNCATKDTNGSDSRYIQDVCL